MNEEAANKLNTLFSIVKHCAEHGAFNKLSTACMAELKKFEEDPTLLGIEYEKPEPKGDVTRVDAPEDNSNIGRPGPRVIPAMPQQPGPEVPPDAQPPGEPPRSENGSNPPVERRV